MLHVLPAEVTLSVLSHLPIPSLLSLLVLSRQWLHFFTTNQSAIFRSAALLHEYIQPETLSLEDALSMNTGRPWAGSTSWKDFCYRSFQLHKNWEGNGRAVARVLSHPGFDIYRIKVDEKSGICITTHVFGGLSVVHLFSSTVLWCLPWWILLGVQTFACSGTSAALPTASTTTGISSLTTKAATTGRRKSGA
ncbi:hypothetical protein EDB83DRAFT_1927674 [Lactarius deliciosus]|nr:hypothetical protein EDB83DRAFT_1927674 [Lactarius deliciosus]